MAPLRFRAWHTYDKKMYPVVGLNLFYSGEWVTANIKVTANIDTDNGVRSDVGIKGDPLHLMQSTGLKDKNGNEIFEGDILQYNMNGHLHVEEVCWTEGEDGEYGYTIAGFFLGKPISDYEVIGNIYENPDLISS